MSANFIRQYSATTADYCKVLQIFRDLRSWQNRARRLLYWNVNIDLDASCHLVAQFTEGRVVRCIDGPRPGCSPVLCSPILHSHRLVSHYEQCLDETR